VRGDSVTSSIWLYDFQLFLLCRTLPVLSRKCRHDPDLVISKERQRLRNLFPVAQDFSLALEMTKALSV
jgi:hypothetical protein